MDGVHLIDTNIQGDLPGSLATQNFGEDYVNRPSSAGCPVAAVELKLCDPDGNPMPEGEVGELWVKGPMNAKEYWNKPEATAKTFIEGWVVTGSI